MPPRWDAATCGWRRRVFHYPPPTLMSGNFWLPCTIELQPLALTPLKMRKVEQRERPGQHDEIMPHHGLPHPLHLCEVLIQHTRLAGIWELFGLLWRNNQARNLHCKPFPSPQT